MISTFRIRHGGTERSSEECKRYFSVMRGHHACKDLFGPKIDKKLTLQREPENAKDGHAVALTEENVLSYTGVVKIPVVLFKEGQP